MTGVAVTQFDSVLKRGFSSTASDDFRVWLDDVGSHLPTGRLFDPSTCEPSASRRTLTSCPIGSKTWRQSVGPARSFNFIDLDHSSPEGDLVFCFQATCDSNLILIEHVWIRTASYGLGLHRVWTRGDSNFRENASEKAQRSKNRNTFSHIFRLLDFNTLQ